MDILPNVSWAAYHAAREGVLPVEPSMNALLPLFYEKSTSPSMMKHGMDIISSVTAHLNPGQVPVMCVDQPLYALAKTVQWNWPMHFGESKFVIMFGPFHTEQNFLRVLGQLLEGSGWVGLVAHSGITTRGSAEARLKVTHVAKARMYHQITAAVLYSLLQEAYDADNTTGELSLEEWIDHRAASSPTFKYWLLVLSLEVLLLSFVRSVRTGDYEHFKEALRSMIQWFFVFDHHHYARWLSVHIKDLWELKSTAPTVHEQFSLGKFIVQKTRKLFSGLGLDHAHEQNNKSVKDNGGPVGLMHDSIRRWTIGGPEVTRLLAEFEAKADFVDAEVHHEQYARFQRKMLDRIAALKDSFQQHENPFTITSTALIALDTRVVVSEQGIQGLYKLESKGREMYNEFVQKRFLTREKSIHDSIDKSGIKIFGAKKVSRNSLVASLKIDVQLFSRLFIVATARDLDLECFFSYENQACPPSLSLNGSIRSGNKSDLTTILENQIPAPERTVQPTMCDGLIYDGGALVRLIKPRPNLKKFSEYFDQQLNPHILNLAKRHGAKRVDVAWDRYNEHSLKSTTRLNRGTGTRMQDLPQKGSLPTNWDDYLRNSANKRELFEFLAQALLKQHDGVEVVTNVGDTWKASKRGISAMDGLNCSHPRMEEADPRIVSHLKDMVQNGAQSVLVRSSDTDVVVLAVSYYHKLSRAGLQQLWLLFGTGKHQRYIAAHTIAMQLGPVKAEALRGFHVFTGCDSVSFLSKGKRTFYRFLDEETLLAFLTLSRPCDSIDEATLRVLERFLCRVYGVKDSDSLVNARRLLFATQNKPLCLIPPTPGALRKHVERTVYVAGHVWGRADELDANVPVPTPDAWGWTLQGDWEPVWTTDPCIWDACRALDRCGCTSQCETRRCLCRRHTLPCTPACKKCQGECSNKSARSNGGEEEEEQPYATADEDEDDVGL